MDEGILLRTAGRFKGSNNKFFEASKIIEMNGYLSLGEQATSLITNERMTTYQGEDFEKVLVHLYLGLNFLSLGDEEGALVETRKVNEILQVMVNEGKRPYEFNAFARYLGAMLFENAGELNDAMVAYRNTLKIDDSLAKRFSSLPVDLFRMGLKLGFDQEIEDWKKSFGAEAFLRAKESLKEKQGAIALLFESGKSPLKISSREYRKTTGRGGTLLEVAIPVSYYESRSSRVSLARIKIEELASTSVTLNDIDHVAKKHLEDRMGRVIAKALLTAATKAAIATGVGKATDSKELGLLTGLALVLLSEADTRSWLLLPEKLQIAKVFLKPGSYAVTVEYLNHSGTVSRTETIPHIDVASGKTTFIQRRSFE
jgi:hypothetical protein